MKRILAPILLVVLLFPSLVLGETMDDLVERDGIHYKKYTDVPFDGEMTGKIQGTFKNGKRDGPWVSYHPNGQLMRAGNYKDGKFDGPWVGYHVNGGLFFKGTLKDGKKDGPWVYYWSNGGLSSKGTYKNGKYVGPWVTYHKNGQLWFKKTY